VIVVLIEVIVLQECSQFLLEIIEVALPLLGSELFVEAGGCQEMLKGIIDVLVFALI
jgi:hypothetical protein